MSDLEAMARLFKSLGDCSRLMIVNVLLAGPLAVHEIATRVSLADPTVSFHLARLAAVGLVTVTRDGQARIYGLVEDALDRRLADLVRVPDAVTQKQEQLAALQRQRVLDAFVVDGRLRSIPAQLKKRRIIWERVIEDFARGQRYAEAEVNGVLARWHEDTATIRRELIDEGLLQRDHGVYWRPE